MQNHNFVLTAIIIGNNRVPICKLLGMYSSNYLLWNYHID